MPSPARCSLALLLGLICACESGHTFNGPIAAQDLEGTWVLTSSVSDPTLSCNFWDVTLELTAIDSTHLSAVYGPGFVSCNGHGFTPADTNIATQHAADTARLDGARLLIAHNANLDTLSGRTSEDLGTIAGVAVNRGTVASDGYYFTMRGTWTAHRAPATP